MSKRRELVQKLHEIRDFKRDLSSSDRVVLLPDFFLDHFVIADMSGNKLLADLSEVNNRGGGNYISDKLKQFYRIGGNSANSAVMLALLGINVTLCIATSKFGLAAFNSLIPEDIKDKLYVEYILTSELATTMALEVKNTNKVANMMVSDPGPVAKFSPDFLTDSMLRAIKNANLVAITNFASNPFLPELVNRISEISKAQIFVDFGDLTMRLDRIADIRNMLKSIPNLTISCNENEIVYITGEKLLKNNDISYYGEKVSKNSKATILVHTAKKAFAFCNGMLISSMPTFQVKVKGATGAGDTWNAGYIAAEMFGLDIDNRLLLGNAAANFLISQEKRPSFPELIHFIKNKLLEGE